MTYEHILRVIVAVSWAAYVAVLIGAIPIPPEAVVGFLFGIFAALIGIAATVAALVNSRRWRVLALIAACVFLVGYAVRVADWSSTAAHTSGTSLLGGLVTVAKDSWSIAQQFYATSGIVGTVPFVFSALVMPLVQVATIWALYASPNQSLNRTRDEAPRAG